MSNANELLNSSCLPTPPSRLSDPPTTIPSPTRHRHDSKRDRHDQGIGRLAQGFGAELDLTAEELAAIAAPCLILCGTADPFAGDDVLDKLADALPSATVNYLADAGHLPFLDDPSWVAKGVEGFLTR